MRLFGALLVLSAVAGVVAQLRPAVWSADLLLLVALLVDFLRTPAPAKLELEREVPEVVGLSREFTRTLILSVSPGASASGARARASGLELEVHELFPASFEVLRRTFDGSEQPPELDDPSGGADRGRFDDDGRLVLRRVYRANLRGVFRLQSLRLRLRGRWGLIERVGRLEGPQTLEVEPALTNLRETLLLAASDRWQDLGVRNLRRHGGETEFESLREYTPGDEVRRVDWKAFARRGKPMVRQYQLERGQELILLVDGGRRMKATVARGQLAGWTKLDWGLDAAIQLAAVALAKGDRVGMAVFDDRVRSWLAPAKGSRQLHRLTRACFHFQPTDHDSDLHQALRELAARHRRRATVVIVSDVADPLSVGRQRAALAAASRRHRLVFAALDDPELRALAQGRTSGTPSARAAAFELIEDRRRGLKALGTSGARVLDALPAEAAAPLLAAWLDERRGAPHQVTSARS